MGLCSSAPRPRADVGPGTRQRAYGRTGHQAARPRNRSPRDVEWREGVVSVKEDLLFILTMVVAILTLLITGDAVAAPGVNLRWVNCFGDGGTLNRNYACGTCSGNSILVGSFLIPEQLDEVTGLDFAVGIATASAVLPPWWEFKNPGACRQTSLSANSTLPGTAISCIDWTSEITIASISSYLIGANGPNTAVVQGSTVASSGSASLSPGQEYFAFNMVINTAKTVGTGSCAGCQTGACLLLSAIRIRGPSGEPLVQLTSPTNLTDSNLCTWQSGGVAQGCPAPTHARPSTWGLVKQLYHSRSP